MASPAVNLVSEGFSVTNRWIIYASMMFTPAQFMSGLASKSPINIGFLAFNIWQQYQWYSAAHNKTLHALSLLPVHLNVTYAITYLGGVPAGNRYLTILSGLGTIALISMNTITAWVSWKTNLPEGKGIYQFFFFGWRRLTNGWLNFFLVWQITDTIMAVLIIYQVYKLICWVNRDRDIPAKEKEALLLVRGTAIFWGSAAMLVIIWPLIMWLELIIKRNNIVSETDMVAVYLFVAQVVLMIIPMILDILEAVYGGWKTWRVSKPLVTVMDKCGCESKKVEKEETEGKAEEV